VGPVQATYLVAAAPAPVARHLVFEAIDPKEVKVRVHDDAAIVMGLYHIKATRNGRNDEPRPEDRPRGRRNCKTPSPVKCR
jgi:hypothetical protein